MRKKNNIPEAIEDLKLDKLSVFNRRKYDEIKVIKYETEVIGDEELTENDRIIFRLPPKFSIEENLPAEGLALEGEMANAKCRMTLRKEEEEKLEDEGIEIETEGEHDESFEEEMEKVEAQSRQIFDPKTRTYNDAKKKSYRPERMCQNHIAQATRHQA